MQHTLNVVLCPTHIPSKQMQFSQCQASGKDTTWFQLSFQPGISAVCCMPVQDGNFCCFVFFNQKVPSYNKTVLLLYKSKKRSRRIWSYLSGWHTFIKLRLGGNIVLKLTTDLSGRRQSEMKLCRLRYEQIFIFPIFVNPKVSRLFIDLQIY